MITPSDSRVRGCVFGEVGEIRGIAEVFVKIVSYPNVPDSGVVT
jgi:hypothetical protein